MTVTVIIRDARSGWQCFRRPKLVLETSERTEVTAMLNDVERRVERDGCVAIGFVAYEAAPAFDAALQTQQVQDTPLLWFALFDAADSSSLPAPIVDAGRWQWQASLTRSSYGRKIECIRAEIAAGNTYQINFTLQQSARVDDDPWSLFTRIAMDAPYATYIETDAFAICSASPELFFRLDGNSIQCRPMKGTAPRGMTTAEDLELQHRLQHSPKDRAENVMIADMLRSDLGRIASTGSVRAESLFDVEKLPTVWQMTSTVSATTGASVGAIFAALFPCASVTGAPKVSSMRLIAALESSPRGLYTGAIGSIAPGRQSQFSVAIRTAWIDKLCGRASYGIGSGVVWDSSADDEFDECLSKSRLLTRLPSLCEFQLLETLRWTPTQGYVHCHAHLDRLGDSALYFDFVCDREAIDALLQRRQVGFEQTDHRVRLLLSRNGDAELIAEPVDLAALRKPQCVRLAARAVDDGDPFLYHKTTHRQVYEKAVAATADADDVLLYNADGFVTETTRANLLVQLNGTWFTPPIRCGLLGGIGRQKLLEIGEIAERAIHCDELTPTTRLTLVNSLRGRYEATLVG